jgi:phage shock protein A
MPPKITLTINPEEGHKARRAVTQQLENLHDDMEDWRRELAQFKGKQSSAVTRHAKLLEERLAKAQEKAEELAEQQRIPTMQFHPLKDPEYFEFIAQKTAAATTVTTTDFAQPQTQSVPTKRKTPDNPDDENPIIKHLNSLEERLGKRIGALEEKISTHSSRRSSRRSSRSPSSRVSATVFGDGQAQHPTQNPTQQPLVEYMQTTPANVNGIAHIPLPPTPHLDAQHILWPHVE